MRAFLLLATATALMLNGSASAQVVQDRWTFDVLTIWRFVASGQSTIKREPYGVFTSRDDCNTARAKKIAELDDGNYRQPHLTANAPTISITTHVGNTSTTREQKGGPIETMFVTDCDVLR